MNAEQLMAILAGCDMERLYAITKIIAESDSVGEGYGYCDNYAREYLAQEIADLKEYGDVRSYLAVGLQVYQAALGKPASGAEMTE